jgi:4-aminobutyrate aminotransferase-like enzyme/Ser/Thr protein kinase RdoA (MazF antagonist)
MSAPVLTEAEVSRWVELLYGVSGTLSALGSCQDVNYKLKSSSGDGAVYVVKISNSATAQHEIVFQNKIMGHLASTESLKGRLQFPVPVNQLDGSLFSKIQLKEYSHFIRLLTYVKGYVLSDSKYFAPEVLFVLGQCVAGVCKSLADFDCTGMVVPELLQWDLQRAPAVISELLPEISDETQRGRLHRVSAAALQLLEPLIPSLQKQIVHGDLAHYNLVATRSQNGGPEITGVIDFGDAMRSWVVGDLAVCITSGFEYAGWKNNALLQASEVLRGFLSVSSLNEQEIQALWPLIRIRSVVNIVCINHELLLDPSNPYNIDGLNKEWIIFDRLDAFDISLGVEFLKSTAVLPTIPRSVYPRWQLSDMICLPGGITPHEIDLSFESQDYNQGCWLSEQVLKQRIQRKGDVTYAEYGIPRFYLGPPRSMTEPASIPLGVDIFVSQRFNVVAPCSAKLYHLEDASVVVLHSDLFDIVLRGVKLCGFESCFSLESAAHVTKGDVLGFIEDAGDKFLPMHINVQVSVRSVHSICNGLPRYCQPSMFAAWSVFCVSPSKLFGLESAERYMGFARSTDEALAKRNRFVASVQQHYFVIPPSIERGFGAYLYDVNGRAYLDVVNNVALVGHCHPSIVSASARQSEMLNTNSRFIYRRLGDFAEKIISTLPKNSRLEVVFFVNSGSEATDLALRIARTVVAQRRRDVLTSANVSLDDFTKGIRNRNVICLEGAYHGITTASDEISTTLNDNPRAKDTRPPWIHLAPMPNPYRGVHPYPSFVSPDPDAQHEQAAADYANAVDNIIMHLTEKNDPPVAFIAEPLSGNAGGVELPKGYLKKVYEKVRNVGGLCISDEVQVGYGRLGTQFWGFMEHAVEPDIITMAKAAGNGHPLGFVVTSRKIADEFGIDGSFFSSAGGGPVSCAIGIAVLEIIMNDELQDNAQTVGDHLRGKLLKLLELFPDTIGAVHGHGLYMGIEIIKDSNSRSPGTEEAYAICRRLLELGVICHNTGDYSNVLKMKPPLVMTFEDADFFVDALIEALQGW